MTSIPQSSRSSSTDLSGTDGTPRYHMTVNLNVLEHLGINLYSNIAAVLTEAVANAWDAYAENVKIIIDSKNKRIEIADDGIGMTIDDMNNKYLHVGYKRRKEDARRGKPKGEKRRVMMGRKGLGKLSLFSIANQIEVQSVKDGESHGLRMSIDKIRKFANNKANNKAPLYSPDALSDREVNIKKGTKIVLRGIKRENLSRGATALRKRLARRFSVIGERHNFRVFIDEEPITTADRGDLQIVQFLWTFGGFKPEEGSIPKVQKKVSLPNHTTTKQIKGWIGTAYAPKQLDSEDAGNLNGIVVFARGRLFHENILEKINDGQFYTKYLTGQIEADFLDTDKEADIATSDRQRIQEDDKRYTDLLLDLRSILTAVEKQWSEWRGKHAVEEAKKISPGLVDWLKSLNVSHRKSAETLIAKLGSLKINNEN